VAQLLVEDRELISPSNWPYWLHAARLLAVAVVAALFALHALTNIRAQRAISPNSRKWAYGLYFIVLLFVMVANFASFGVALVRREYVDVPRYRIGLFSLLVVASYVPLLVRFRRPRL